MQDMLKKLEKVLTKVTGRKISVQEGQDFKRDLAVDSLSMVELVLETEIEFGVTFDRSELTEENLATTSALMRLLENKE